MGGHDVTTFYRYDGRQYQSVYGYTAMAAGTDDNGNDLVIAWPAQPDVDVVCH